MRAADRNRFRFKAVVVASLMVLGGTVALLTFVAPKYLVRPLPLGIAEQEVATYARWFDRDRPGESTGTLPVFQMPDGPVPVSSTPATITINGREGLVRWSIAPGRTGALEVQTAQTDLLGADTHVVLHPATPRDILYKYLQVAAEELGLLTPEVGFVTVEHNGVSSLYRKEAVTDGAWMARHGILDAVPFRMGFDPTRPDHARPAVFSDAARSAMLADRLAGLCVQGDPAPPAVLLEHVDADAAAAWFLMLHLEGDPAAMARMQQFYYREATGRIFPVFTHAPPWPIPAPAATACDPFTPLLGDTGFMQQLQARREHLLDVRGQLRERFAALDKALLPLLAGDGSVRLVQAQAKAIADSLLDMRLGAPIAGLDLAPHRVPHAGWAAWQSGSESTVGATQMATHGGPSLADIRRRYWIEMRGDTIVFRRAKYKVQDDLVLPSGHPVLMLSGARIDLAPGRSLVCQGPLEVRATDLNPVFVRAAGSAPFGTIAVLAQGGDVRIKGMRMSGGVGATVGAVEHPAMLSIHGAANVTIESTHLDMEHSGQVLALDGGRLHMDGGRCTGGPVLLRRVQGTVHDVVLSNGARQRAQVGLQAVGGRLVLDSVRFEDFSDAALFAADGAQMLVTSAGFTRNGTAIRSGDLSVVHVDGTHFTRNGRVCHVPAPQPDTPGGQILLYANTMEANERDQEVDGTGSVQRRDRLDAAVRMAFGIRP